VLSMKKTKRSTKTLWWIASLILITAGTLGLGYSVSSGPETGPTLPGPIGQITLPPATTTTLAPAVTTTVPVTAATSGLYMGAPSVALASYQVPSLTSKVRYSSMTALAKKKTRVVPVHLRIPAIGLSDPLSQLGLSKGGTVQVPTNVHVPGWYKYGAVPGQLGSAVILGHVDSVSGPAAFYKLAALRPGNKVYVTLSNGHVVGFKVIGLRMYQKTTFPDKLVYGYHPYSALQLVTCGGIFDVATGHYLSNIVVFTVKISG